jgi:hypothetical protein
MKASVIPKMDGKSQVREVCTPEPSEAAAE